MDLELSPEHMLLQRTVRDFMDREVAPIVAEHERDRRFPAEIVRRLADLGWLGIHLDKGLAWTVVASLVEEAHRITAPKPLVRKRRARGKIG